jgi:regulator of sirC expression with transglutaminase-like and TPR domain
MRNKAMMAVLIGLFAVAVLGGMTLILQPFRPPLLPQSTATAEQREIQTQIAAYESLIAENPDHPKYHQGLGDLYWSLREWEKAAEHLAQALALNPEDDELRLMTAMARWHAGQTEEAVRLLQTAVERNPEDPTAPFYLGMLLATQEGREAEAIAALERAVELAGDSELALQARRRLVELRRKAGLAPGSGANPATDTATTAEPAVGPSEPSWGLAASTLFPRVLGGLELKEAYGGERAKQEIERLHGGKVRIERGFVAYYAKGERSATFWITASAAGAFGAHPEASSEGEAIKLVERMREAITRGRTPFSPLEQIAVPGLEMIPVYSTEGMGQFHYIWVKKVWVIWVALDEPDLEKRLEFLKEAIVFVG